MNKVLYFTFVNVPVKFVILGIIGFIFLLSLPETKDVSKSIKFSCMTQPMMTTRIDKKGNNVWSCTSKG